MTAPSPSTRRVGLTSRPDHGDPNDCGPAFFSRWPDASYARRFFASTLGAAATMAMATRASRRIRNPRIRILRFRSTARPVFVTRFTRRADLRSAPSLLSRGVDDGLAALAEEF